LKFIFLILCMGTQFAFASKVIFLGDSLTEGYGIESKYSYPALIQNFLLKDKIEAEVINAGISGATSANGVSRLNWLMKAKPQVLVLALGANDGLRGLPVANTFMNLEKIIQKAKEHHVKVLLLGMKVPPNMGKEYALAFEQNFMDLAQKYSLAHVPFILEGVAGDPTLNLADGIHPNQKGYEVIAKNIYPHLKKLL